MDTRFLASGTASLEKENPKMNIAGSTKMSIVAKKLYLHVAVLTVSCVGTISANAAGFAEELYMDFSEFSDNKIIFEVSASKPESLASADNLTIGSFLPPGSHIVNFRQGRINIDSVGFEDGKSHPLLMEMRQQKMIGFKDGLLPMSSGTFRILSVKAIVDDEVRQSQAVEFCWPAQGYCYVEDNSIPNLWGAVTMIRELLAAGYKETVTYYDSPAEPQSKGFYGNCYVSGTSNTQVGKRNDAIVNQSVYAGSTLVGTYSSPESVVRMGCEVDSQIRRTCRVRLLEFSVPNSSGTATSNHSIDCEPSKKKVSTCSDRGWVASEQGCAWGRRQTSWGFSFSISDLSCAANVAVESSNTVAIRTRALDQSINCDYKANTIF